MNRHYVTTAISAELARAERRLEQARSDAEYESARQLVAWLRALQPQRAA